MKMRDILVACAAGIVLTGGARDTAIYNGKLTSAMNANGFAITNAAAPVGANDLATKQYVDSVSGVTPSVVTSVANYRISKEVASWARAGQPQPTGSVTDVKTNGVSAVVNGVANIVLTGGGGGGTGGIDTNGVNGLIAKYDETNLTTRIAAKQAKLEVIKGVPNQWTYEAKEAPTPILEYYGPPSYIAFNEKWSMSFRVQSGMEAVFSEAGAYGPNAKDVLMTGNGYTIRALFGQTRTQIVGEVDDAPDAAHTNRVITSSGVANAISGFATEDYVRDATNSLMSRIADEYIQHVKDVSGDRTAVTLGNRKLGEDVGVKSVSVGENNVASGVDSIAVGASVDAIGNYSIAHGNATAAEGSYARAYGNRSEALGDYSVAQGLYARARDADSSSWVWNGSPTNRTDTRYMSHGEGTFSINPKGGADGFYIGEKKITGVISETATPIVNASVANVSSIVATWENFLDGSNVVFSITNYISGSYSTDFAKLRILEMRNGAYSEVYNSHTEITNHIGKFKSGDFKTATNSIVTATNNQLANKADKSWGQYTSAGGEAPSNTVYMTAPNTVFAGGMEYERVAVGEGAVCVLTTKGAPVWTSGDEGTFKFQDDGGTNYFGFAKTDSYTIGCDTDGISVNNHIVSLTYNVTMSGVPCIWYKSDLANTNAWEKLNLPDGTAVPGASHTVSWDQSPAAGTEVCYINCPEAKGFFKASIEVTGSAKFMTNMPADFGGGILCTDGIHKVKINWNNGSPTFVEVQ